MSTPHDVGDDSATATAVVTESTSTGAITRRTDRRMFRTKDESMAERRLVNGTPLAASRIIPSDAPMPLAAQRDFRGWIVVGIILLLVIIAGLLLGIVARISKRSVFYAPTAEHIGAASAGREPTDWEATTTAKMLVATLESYTPATAEHLWEVVLPFLDPSMHAKIREDYEVVARKAKTLWVHRVAIPLGTGTFKRHEGIISVAVYYDSCELTGQSVETRVFNRVVEKAAYIEFAVDVPTKENPLGLVMKTYVSLSHDEWIEHGFKANWDMFRKPEKR